MSNNTTRESLKIKALLERISDLEDKNSDLRVDLTILSLQNQQFRNDSVPDTDSESSGLPEE